MYVSQGTEYGISYDGYGSRDGTGTDDFWKYDDGTERVRNNFEKIGTET